MRYFFSILFIILGFLLVKYSNWIVNNFGAVSFAEDHLHSMGGTRFFWKALGILIIIVSFLVISGFVEPLLLKIFRPGGGF